MGKPIHPDISAVDLLKLPTANANINKLVNTLHILVTATAAALAYSLNNCPATKQGTHNHPMQPPKSSELPTLPMHGWQLNSLLNALCLYAHAHVCVHMLVFVLSS